GPWQVGTTSMMASPLGPKKHGIEYRSRLYVLITRCLVERYSSLVQRTMTLPVFTSSASGTTSTARQWPDGMRTASPGTSPWARNVIMALSVCGAMPYWRLPTSFCGGEGRRDMGRGGVSKKSSKKAGGTPQD